MSPPPKCRGDRPRPGTATANTITTAPARKLQDQQQSTARDKSHRVDEPVYPASFAEWDQLIRERPFGRSWSR